MLLHFYTPVKLHNNFQIANSVAKGQLWYEVMKTKFVEAFFGNFIILYLKSAKIWLLGCQYAAAKLVSN